MAEPIDPHSRQRQKQVDQALLRVRDNKPPRGKCSAYIRGVFVLFCHYHHLLLVYNQKTRKAVYRWHELPTDLRILLAAEAALDDGILNQNSLLDSQELSDARDV